MQSVLALEIIPSADPQQRRQIELPLAELIAGYRHETLDSKGNQILIQRVGGDQLRVRFDRPSLVFSPGESFEFEVVTHQTGLDVLSELRCHVQLFRAGDDRQLWDHNAELRVGHN